ncbi:hypothetical protein OZ411_10070 [Bradyrhizobium sp. Arg237L]|uniref:hypothetical protein n=1 Tax=Bradyrhizobium sp. Arg237L TaxID=3003352 RepID=UPI00249E15DE|nr:hypothetical protein [Bradyrhizobium sp. Arg237L]MDI4233156.1 hypothetical protein [Bradyrhizobium sp. Arg237L]
MTGSAQSGIAEALATPFPDYAALHPRYELRAGYVDGGQAECVAMLVQVGDHLSKQYDFKD